jgi:hypothetical protein
VQKGLQFKHALVAFFSILVPALVGCGGGSEARLFSEAEPFSNSPTETTAPIAGVAEPTTDQESPPHAVQAAQRAVDQAASVDAKEVYTNTLQAARPVGSLMKNCEPTQPDMLGPFYKPDAPVRTSVGSGYVLSGTVLAANSCEPIRDAQIEFWLVNPEGVYDDAHRATVPAEGEYQFESNVPVPYQGRPSHIHLRVTAQGYQELVAQHYPDAGQTEATFDLVLEPA